MKILLIVVIWLVFALLAIYTGFAWVKPNALKNRHAIRKTWYLIFIFGCLIYISYDPPSLFNDWKSYLIVFVVFIIVDSMVFLNLYFSNIGGQQLEQTEQAVCATQESLDETKRKMGNLSNVLNSFAFPEYNDNEEEYIQDFEDLLNRYAAEEALVVDLLPYTNDEEKKQALEGTPENKARRLLSLRRTYYSSKDTLMLHPVILHDKEYVARVSTLGDNKVTEVDAQVINIFLVVYTLTVKDTCHKGGGE
ncbi:type II toxin-antitoxin system SpoIISA family toxin [Camelliibacillus cellulosilyticus]|uniref:Type II toxin-antitoxin system SpoIISA family toxin n=1 Tax=Camelliibacillus cellulosilyticus TaxID=2174486 RepID=A0ABV9GLQ9_9BACL